MQLTHLIFGLSALAASTSAVSIKNPDIFCLYDDPNILFNLLVDSDGGRVTYRASLDQGKCMRNNNGTLYAQENGGADCSTCGIFEGEIQCYCSNDNGDSVPASIALQSVVTTLASTLFACGTNIATATPWFTQTTTVVATNTATATATST